MKTRNSKAIMMIGILSIVLVAGCGTVSTSSVFDDNGLPRDRYYVGGGFRLDFGAPAKGTAYVVEEISNQLIGTKSLENDERFEVDIDPREEDVHMRLKSIGVDPVNMKLGLYFVPSRPVEGSSE